MRLFYLNRLDDESGVSGVGLVCEGVVFDNGTVVLSWLTRCHSIGVYPTLTAMLEVHGHGGKTIIDWSPNILRSI